ncbi:MAG: hypothetical protein M3O71_21520 [Bacteroidota bacterium]|nr:hypothetical protein [Bacteroidota bacterium]
MKLLEKYYHITEATGVSITIEKNGSYTLSACSVGVENNQLNFQRKLTGITSLNELVKQVPPKTLVALNLSGKGVLQKQVEKIEEIDQNSFSRILPNAKPEDYYIQNFISGDQSFISVIRRTEADKWIGQLKEQGFVPLMLSLGPFPVEHVLPQLNVYDQDVKVDGHIIRRNERLEWISCQYNEAAAAPFPLKIESESIDEKLLIAYASAFQLVLSNKLNVIQAAVPSLADDYHKLLAERKLKVHGALILVAFFVLLLVNFGVFSWLNSANAKLTEQVSRSAQSSSDVQQVGEQIEQKEALLKTLGWEDNINKSALIDQIASLLPSEITWQEASVDPVDIAQSRSQKGIVFASRLIRITGSCERIIPVNEWIARIKTKTWVKNAQLDSYTFNQELNTGKFTLLISY